MTAIAGSPAPTVAAALLEAARQLREAGVEQPRLDARLLLGAALGCPGDALYGRETETIAPARRRAFTQLVARRRNREPVSRILGRREFWSLPLSITAATLDPRPDSETLVAAMLETFADRSAPLRILDLGTGSGCLLLAALSEYPQARGLGIDIDSACVAVGRRNAAALGLDRRARFRAGDWTCGLDMSFDAVLANPPYVPTAAVAALDREVAGHDPILALDGGTDGLDCHRRLADGLPAALARGGRAFLEIGDSQAESVRRILSGAGLRCVAARRDLGGRLRCLVISRNDREEKSAAGLD